MTRTSEDPGPGTSEDPGPQGLASLSGTVDHLNPEWRTVEVTVEAAIQLAHDRGARRRGPGETGT